MRHKLSNINLDEKIADCSVCGNNISIKYSPKGGKRCLAAIREYRKKYGGRYRYHEPNPGICDVCENDRLVSFDHDHASGIFRGWLCINCNTTLGLVHDDPARLQQLINYLEK